MSIFRSRIMALSFVLAQFAALATPVMAQIDIGSISGVVTDPQGGVIQGAQVIAIESSTHVATVATTNSEGVYVVLSLPSGNYDLTISHPGFEALTNQGVPLASGENKKLDARLVVGRVAQRVEVVGSAPALETREGSYSLDEGTDSLAQLPLEVSGGKRDATQYLTALPGYQPNAGQGSFEAQMLGSLAGYSEVYVDGTPEEVGSGAHGGVQNFFSAEGVAEVKVVTTPMADLGNTGGIAISYITKSGTNQLHGSAYTFMRNTLFDASCDQFCPGPKPVDHQGEYGFQMGGPVYIPHVYDGRNKTFWWFNWGHFFYNYTVGETFASVPTGAMKGGDFSEFLGPKIGTDPLGNPVYQGEIYNPNTTTTVGGQIVRTPFGSGTALNMIPTNLFSSVASKYQAYFPAPTSSILPSVGSNWSTAGAAGVSPDTYFQIDIDQSIGSKDRLWGTYWSDNQVPKPVIQLPAFFSVAFGGGATAEDLHINWTHAFSSHLVNEASFGYDRNYGAQLYAPLAQTGASLIGEVHALGPCTPSFNIVGGYMASNRSDDLCNEAQGDTNEEYSDVWSLAKGSHLIKWGFNAIRYNANYPSYSNLEAGFLTAETSLPDSPTCPTCATDTGNSYASFLLGAVDNAETRVAAFSSPRTFQYGFFGQDEFKVTHRFTLTYGLRWDEQLFPVEVQNRYSQFEPTLPNPGCNGCPGALAFLGFGTGTLNTRSVVPNQYFSTTFGPKLGFAYQVEKNTVVRGAVTLAYGPVNQTMAGFANEAQQGYFPSFSTTSPNGISPAFYLDNGYPFAPGTSFTTNFNPAVGNGSGTAFFGNTSAKGPRILNTHFGIEHQFLGRVVVGLQYNGSYAHGVITGAGQPLNQLDYSKYASYGLTCLQSDITQAVANCPGETISLPYASYTGTVEQALRPFPQFQDIENQSAPTGTSTYSSGQVTAKKHFSDGLSFFVGYTLSRQFSNLNSIPGFFSAPAQNAYNPNAEKAPGYADIPNQLTLNYTYQLPIGRGKRLNVDNRSLDAVVGGWSVAGIQNYESGTPLAISSNTILFSQPEIATASNSVRPNMVPGQNIRSNIGCPDFNPAGGDASVSDTYLNPGAFVMPGPLQFGDAPRAFGSARTCGLYNENFTIYKTFLLTERLNFRFGTDFFNIFNRHDWAAPDTDFQDPNFGKILGLANTPRSIQFNGRLSF